MTLLVVLVGLFVSLMLLDLINILTVTHVSAHVRGGEIYPARRARGRRCGDNPRRAAPKRTEIAITPPKDSRLRITRPKG